MTAPVDLPTNATTELGTAVSVYQNWQGVDQKTGDWYDWAQEWQTRDIDQMLEVDGRAEAIAKCLTLPVAAAPIAIKPGDGDTGECEQLTESLARMRTPLPMVIAQAAWSQIYRATFLEAVFDVSRGQVDYASLAWRPPDTCAILRDRQTGVINGFRQEIAGGTEPARILGDKSVIFMHGADRNPIRGFSEMQVSLRCFRDKQKLRTLWMLMCQRAASPWVVAQTENDTAGVASALSKLRNGGVAAVRKLDALDVLNVAGEAATIFQSALKFLDSEMAGSVLAGFLDLTSGGVGASTGHAGGSLALSRDQTDFFTASRDASAREISTQAKHQIAEPFTRLNRGPAGVVPNFTIGPISGADLQQVVTLLGQLATVPVGGPFPQSFTNELVVKAASLLDLDVDKVMADIRDLAPKAATEAPGADRSAGLHAAITALSNAIDAAQDADPKALIDLASINGHHIPGTAYHWRHNWRPIDVYTAIKHKLGRQARDLHAAGAPFHNEEPEGVPGVPRELPHPEGHVHGGGAGQPHIQLPTPSHGTPAGIPVSDRLRVAPGPQSQVGKSARKAIAAIDAVHHDGDLNEIPLSQDASRKHNGQYTFSGLGNDNIKISTYGDHKELTTAHEIGHWLDYRGFGDRPGSTAKLAGRADSTPGWQAWAHAVSDSPQVRELMRMRQDPKEPNRRYLTYALTPEELWARSYAQYIAHRSGDPQMLDQVEKIVTTDTASIGRIVSHTQWRESDFAPIEAAIDEILREKGWRV